MRIAVSTVVGATEIPTWHSHGRSNRAVGAESNRPLRRRKPAARPAVARDGNAVGRVRRGRFPRAAEKMRWASG